MILGSLGEIGRMVGTDGWLALYALACVIFALRRGERIRTKGFTYWDEASWLFASAVTWRIASTALA